MTGEQSSEAGVDRVLRVRWLGRVGYEESHVLQRALHARSPDEHLLLLEHPHVFTLGVHGDPAHVLVDPEVVGARLIRTDRGGDVTYHGPGQLVAYPILNVPVGPGAVPGHVRVIEQVVIDTLGEFGIAAGRMSRYPGVWIDPDRDQARKICAVGVRVSRGRSMHGLALNVDPDMSWFERIIPCGIAQMPVTSMAAEGVRPAMREVIDALARHARARWAGDGEWERQDVVAFEADLASSFTQPEHAPGSRLRVRLRSAGVDPGDGLPLAARKPPWLRVNAHMGQEFLGLRRTMKGLGLVTVCEEAGCPNIFECWAAGTATFMINGERCTRACGFCLVDTRHPGPLDASEPSRVADAVERMGLEHAVVTAVARDDLEDGGAAAFASTIDAIRSRSAGTTVEVLVPDCKGDASSIGAITGARPDVFNHNLETVARLQRAVRPSAGYARSLAVLARGKDAGLVTKSGLVLGMGETEPEVVGAMADLRAVGVDILTLGQYLRPSVAHLPVAKWWTPDEFDRLGEIGRSMGFAHVQSSPLTRSSYHARDAARASNLGVGATR